MTRRAWRRTVEGHVQLQHAPTTTVAVGPHVPPAWGHAAAQTERGTAAGVDALGQCRPCVGCCCAAVAHVGRLERALWTWQPEVLRQVR